MKSSKVMIVAGAVVATLSLAPLAQAQTAAKAAAPPKGKAAVASTTVTATVTQVDQKTREVTLKTQDGRDVSFVAGDEVKNLAQMKVGDVVTATYAEALAYEVKKGGTARASQAVGSGSAKAGAKPAGVLARQTTVTVTITAIDPAVPSVTFKGPLGNTRTVKVLHPENLQGVSVGDTVEITYTEALAIKVENAKK
jgi:uncharacterized protein YigE (DUF2233 family)